MYIYIFRERERVINIESQTNHEYMYILVRHSVNLQNL